MPKPQQESAQRGKGVESCPVFHPSEAEFKNFGEYIMSIEQQVLQYGACRIVPPAGWKARETSYDCDEVNEMVLAAPVRQETMGRAGCYNMYCLTQKPMTVKQYKQMAGKPDNQPPESLRARWPGSDEDEVESFEHEGLEKKYWQGFSGKPPIYGSDNHSRTLFEECAGEWNLSGLPTILRQKIRQTLPGINSPYMYMGMWRASFPWHVEDMDLYSINFLHWGQPKLWYAISWQHGEQLERLAAGLQPDAANKCKQFLRHKSTVISPSHLTSAGIPVTRVLQHPGEFVITMPYAYHSGFNLGLNCAEAVNFASETWIPYGERAKLCRCYKDSCRLRMEAFSKDSKYDKEVNLEEAIDDIVCEGCGEGTDDETIVLCESCTAGYHLHCCSPPLQSVPRGRWVCHICAKEEETQNAVDQEPEYKAKKGKCCACGLICEDVKQMDAHPDLSRAWMMRADLGVMPLGKILMCEGCTDWRAEADYTQSEEDGRHGVCLWCGSNRASDEQGPDLLCCSNCPRGVCEACIVRNMGRDSLEKARVDEAWVCAICDAATLAGKGCKSAGERALKVARTVTCASGWSEKECDRLVTCLRVMAVSELGGGTWEDILLVYGDGPGKGKTQGAVKRDAKDIKSLVGKLNRVRNGGLWADLGLSQSVFGEGEEAASCHFCGGKSQRVLMCCSKNGCKQKFCQVCLPKFFPSAWDYLLAAAARVVRPSEGGGTWPYSKCVWMKGAAMHGESVRSCDLLAVGDVVECEDMGGFYAARVLETKKGSDADGGQRVRIHFTGWKSRFDQWCPLSSPRLYDERKNCAEYNLEKHSKGGAMIRKVPAHVMRAIKSFRRKRKRAGKGEEEDERESKKVMRNQEGRGECLFSKCLKKRVATNEKKIVAQGWRSSARVRAIVAAVPASEQHSADDVHVKTLDGPIAAAAVPAYGKAEAQVIHAKAYHDVIAADVPVSHDAAAANFSAKVPCATVVHANASGSTSSVQSPCARMILGTAPEGQPQSYRSELPVEGKSSIWVLPQHERHFPAFDGESNHAAAKNVAAPPLVDAGRTSLPDDLSSAELSAYSRIGDSSSAELSAYSRIGGLVPADPCMPSETGGSTTLDANVAQMANLIRADFSVGLGAMCGVGFREQEQECVVLSSDGALVDQSVMQRFGGRGLFSASLNAVVPEVLKASEQMHLGVVRGRGTQVSHKETSVGLLFGCNVSQKQDAVSSLCSDVPDLHSELPSGAGGAGCRLIIDILPALAAAAIQDTSDSFVQDTSDSFGQDTSDSFGQDTSDSFGQDTSDSFGQDPSDSFRHAGKTIEQADRGLEDDSGVLGQGVVCKIRDDGTEAVQKDMREDMDPLAWCAGLNLEDMGVESCSKSEKRESSRSECTLGRCVDACMQIGGRVSADSSATRSEHRMTTGEIVELDPKTTYGFSVDPERLSRDGLSVDPERMSRDGLSVNPELLSGRTQGGQTEIGAGLVRSQQVGEGKHAMTNFVDHIYDEMNIEAILGHGKDSSGMIDSKENDGSVSFENVEIKSHVGQKGCDVKGSSVDCLVDGKFEIPGGAEKESCNVRDPKVNSQGEADDIMLVAASEQGGKPDRETEGTKENGAGESTEGIGGIQAHEKAETGVVESSRKYAHGVAIVQEIIEAGEAKAAGERKEHGQMQVEETGGREREGSSKAVLQGKSVMKNQRANREYRLKLAEQDTINLDALLTAKGLGRRGKLCGVLFVEYPPAFTCPVCMQDCPCSMNDPSLEIPCLRLKNRTKKIKPQEAPATPSTSRKSRKQDIADAKNGSKKARSADESVLIHLS